MQPQTYLHGQLPDNIWNDSGGGTYNYNGQQVKVSVNSNGTRTLTPTGSSGDSGGLMDTAKQLNDFQVQQNQPAIEAYQASKQPLQDRYAALIDQIKNNGQIQTNRQTVTTNNELGRRGISSDSGVGQQEMTNTLNPITQGITDQTAATTGQENSDLSAIDQAIAQLKAGNPSSSISTALGFGQQQANTALAQSQLSATQAQNAIANAISMGNLNNSTAQTNYAVNKPYFSPLETAQAQYYNNPGLLSSILGIGGGGVSTGSGQNYSPNLSSFVK